MKGAFPLEATKIHPCRLILPIMDTAAIREGGESLQRCCQLP